MGELPTYTGNNDSTPASIVAFMGYRAIQVDSEVLREPIEKKSFAKKVRRAQHLLLSFLITKKYVNVRGLYEESAFDKIWTIEWYLHVVNPWLLLLSAAIFLVTAIEFRSLTALAAFLVGVLLLPSRAFRMWLLQQIYLVVASVRNIWTRDVVWKK
jgi:hypothetical protein